MKLLLVSCLLVGVVVQPSAARRAKEVCKTPACNDAAAVMSKFLKPTADPCNNFYEYACGKFVDEAVIPPFAFSVGSIETVKKTDKEEKMAILNNPVSTREYERKMKLYYNACLDVDAIEKFGTKLLTKWDRRNWPTLNPDLTTYMDYPKLFHRFEKDLLMPLFHYGLTVKGTRDNAVNILQVLLGKYKQPVDGFVEYYGNLTVYLGADEQTARKDAQDLVKLINEMNKYVIQGPDAKDPKITRNLMRLSDMNAKYNYFQWDRLFKVEVFNAVNDTRGVSLKTHVNVRNLKYFENLGTILKNAGPRTVQNYYAMIQGDGKIGESTQELRDIVFKFYQVESGVKQPTPRDQWCYGNTNTIFDVGLTKLVSERSFTPEMKTSLDKMVGHVKDALRRVLRKAKWMDRKTIKQNMRKLDALKEKIGVWDKNWNDQAIEEYYKYFDIKEGDSYAEMSYMVKKQYKANDLRNINRPVETWKFSTPMTEVNGAADMDQLAILFMLPMLRSPFYNGTAPNYINFASIGYVIGHELLHHFDRYGKNIDHKAQPIDDLWTPVDDKEYNKREQCFIDQYDKIKVHQIDTFINGTLTVQETVADNGGAKMAYLAYKQFAKTQTKKELPLDVNGLNIDQLFYVAMGQSWCAKMHDWVAEWYVENSVWPITDARVNGIMMNQPGFASAFKCKKNSPMNPDKKCVLF